MIFQEKLQKKIQNLAGTNKPNLEISPADCDKLLNDYINQTRNTEIANYFFEKSLEEKFEEAYYAADILLESIKTEFFFKLAKDFFRIQSLRVCSFIITLIVQGNVKEAINLIGVLMHYAVKNLAADEIITYQIQIFFSEVVDHLSGSIGVNKEIVSEINDCINLFQISEKMAGFYKLQEPGVNLNFFLKNFLGYFFAKTRIFMEESRKSLKNIIRIS